MTESAELEPTDEKIPPEVLHALFVAHLKSWSTAEEKITRPLAGQHQPHAGQTPYRAATGEKLGYIQRTDPAPEWKVTDGALLDEHLMKDPANVVEDQVLDPPSAQELVALVAEHRPDWLKDVTYLRPGARADALARARKSGEPEPGIELYRPEGVLRVVADKGAGEVFGRMIRAGELNLDGSTPEAVARIPRPAVETRLPQLGTRVTTRMKDAADDAYDRGEDPWWSEDDPFAADPFAGIEIQS